MAEKLHTSVVIFFRVLDGLILFRFLLGFFPVPKENKLKIFLREVTEPILSPVRKMIAHSVYGENLMFDISPFLALIVLGIIEFIIIQIIAVF